MKSPYLHADVVLMRHLGRGRVNHTANDRIHFRRQNCMFTRIHELKKHATSDASCNSERCTILVIRLGITTTIDD